MKEERLKNICKELSGLQQSDWDQVKGAVDYEFNQKATKLQLDGSTTLYEKLSKHVILRQS